MAVITAEVQAAGALMIWDLAHCNPPAISHALVRSSSDHFPATNREFAGLLSAAGAVPVDLLGSNADMAFGCGCGPRLPGFRNSRTCGRLLTGALYAVRTTQV